MMNYDCIIVGGELPDCKQRFNWGDTAVIEF